MSRSLVQQTVFIFVHQFQVISSCCDWNRFLFARNRWNAFSISAKQKFVIFFIWFSLVKFVIFWRQKKKTHTYTKKSVVKIIIRKELKYAYKRWIYANEIKISQLLISQSDCKSSWFLFLSTVIIILFIVSFEHIWFNVITKIQWNKVF